MLNAARPTSANDTATTIRNLTSALEDMHKTVASKVVKAQQRDRDSKQRLDEEADKVRTLVEELCLERAAHEAIRAEEKWAEVRLAR
jgi:hypothetical protein